MQVAAEPVEVAARPLAFPVGAVAVKHRRMPRRLVGARVNRVTPVQAVALAQLALRCQSGPPPREQPA
jgi:hypothetical protein